MALDSITFYLKVRILRWLTQLLAWLDRRRRPASSCTPSSQIRIPPTLSISPRSFDTFLYHPPNYTRDPTNHAQYPLVIVLHGGGWCVGDARHDERFIKTLTARGVVVAAVNYRLAPEHPYPIPVSDCLDALLYLWKNSQSMNLDKDRTFIAGFSVGGQMAFASQFMLWSALQEKVTRINPSALGTVKGITAFYPPMDGTKSRAERAASNPSFVALKNKPISSSKMIGDIFDRAYFWNLPALPDKSHMCISPGLAPEDVVKASLPMRIFIKPAGLDPLLAEGVAAAERFRDLGKQVKCEVIQGVAHYWDHLAKTDQEKTLRQEVHERAADEIAEVLEIN
ncbi:Alpha/Beta hydrolase protein [Aspergillus pseudoustus]|uniref:Alpha/Beta hydrolase protein n=1 Tax=Aspergillus pseudoustus TaxID=1810923 RepID=A0ABR4JA99_9EURO